MGLIRKERVYQVKLPSGAYFYKVKDGKTIYKNKYLSEYYITYKEPNSIQYIVEQYGGECSC